MKLDIKQAETISMKITQLSGALFENIKEHSPLWIAGGIGLLALVVIAVILCSCCCAK